MFALEGAPIINGRFEKVYGDCHRHSAICHSFIKVETDTHDLPSRELVLTLGTLWLTDAAKLFPFLITFIPRTRS